MSTIPTNVAGALDREGAVLLQRAPRSLWRDAWRRMRRNKMAILGMIYIVILTVVALFASSISPHNPMKATPNLREAGTFRLPAWETHATNPKKSGDWRYILGTDSTGRDIFTRLIYGARVSILVGFVPMVITIIIGTLFGLISGFIGGRTDNILMRIADVVYAFPDLLFFIIMISALRETALGKFWNGFLLLFISLSVVGWVGVARLVRGQVLSIKEKEFIEAARAVGATAPRIVFKHILPNCVAPLIVAAAFIIPGAVITEAILGYIGIGTSSDSRPGALFPTSWGSQILEGNGARDSQPWILIAPALAVALMSLAFTSIGDGLRDALDPRGED
jgi:oligopeptide transport system permease protein